MPLIHGCRSPGNLGKVMEIHEKLVSQGKFGKNEILLQMS